MPLSLCARLGLVYSPPVTARNRLSCGREANLIHSDYLRFLRFPVLIAACAAAFAQTCPNPPVASVTSPKMPADVCIPDPFTNLTIAFFDDYSWRSLIAMVWPAAKGKRGVPDASKTVSGPGPRVFETYKSLWEVFHEDGSAPNSDFQAYEAAAYNACKAETGWGGVLLATSTPWGDIGQAGIGELVGPVVAQNGRYVRYQTLYNQAAFDAIVQNRFYLRDQLPVVPRPRPETPVFQFPNGSVAIKVAWLDLRGFPSRQRKRFYTRPALVRDPQSGKCSKTEMGLVGLHVVQKTPSRPQWIWSSFEQVDTVPMFQGGAGDFIFNNGTPEPMPPENPLSLVPLAREPVKPYNVVRSIIAPINFDTSVMNRRYQNLLAGSVWEYYRVVTTQWPLIAGNQAVPVPASLSGEIFNTFPGNGPGATAKSAYANVTIETFDQDRPELGCMSCHNQARMQMDFMWSVLDHAYPATLAPAAKAVRQPPNRR